MGIILKGLSSRTGIHSNRFTEFDHSDNEVEEGTEQHMTDEGVFSSNHNADVLTMQNLDDTSNSVAFLGSTTPKNKKKNV